MLKVVRYALFVLFAAACQYWTPVQPSLSSCVTHHIFQQVWNVLAAKRYQYEHNIAIRAMF